MKAIYISKNNKLVNVDKIGRRNLIQLVDPDLEEIHEVASSLNIPIDFLTDVLDIDERPRIEKRGLATLLIMHIPYDDQNVKLLYEDVKYKTIPFGMVFIENYTITVCKEKNFINKTFFEKNGFFLDDEKQSNNLFSIINRIALEFSHAAKMVDEAINEAEDELSHSYRNQELYTLLYLNESLIYLTTSLKNIMHIMNRMRKNQPLCMGDGAYDLFNEALVEIEQIHSITKISQINLNNVMDAYGNVIQNNVSHIVKLLTAVTIILSIPTLIASIYGMNVPLPFQDEENAFTFIIISMLFFSGIVAYFFHKKRYF